MTARTVLVSGASIAGPTLAYWLKRHGWQPTIVERAPTLRTGGQNIDVRGAGRTVARRTGIEDAIRAATTGEQGLRFVDASGRTRAEFPAGTSQTDGATAELEILRGDLARLLYDRTRDDTPYLFGDRITALRDSGDRVDVSFEHGEDRSFDLVVIADGVRSSTRALVFGDEPQMKFLGLCTTYLTIPRSADDDAWWRWYNAPGGRSIMLRPDNVGTTRAAMSFLSDTQSYERLGSEQQKAVLRDKFADAGWQAPRILAALDGASDMYFDAIAQVRAPRWSSGRIALLGDAAYCASPISGMGTSLALVGAYVLAGELATHADHRDAFAGYERILRPYVDQAQKLPPGAPRLAHPKSRIGVELFRAAARLASSPALKTLGGKLFTPPSDQIDLPDYAHSRQ